MVMLAESVDAVIGVDTHTDTHTACLLDNTGREIATITIEATPAGYAALLGAGAGSRSPPELGGGGLPVTRRWPGPCAGGRRSSRRGSRPTHPCRTPPRREVRSSRCSLGRPGGSRRDASRRLSTPRQTAACAVLRVHAHHTLSEQVLRQTLRGLAQQIRPLDKQIRANERQLRGLVETTMPNLLNEPGVGAVSAAHLIVAWSHRGRCRSDAAFAALAGVSPIEASSGRITRHRLNRFGDRRLNRALHTIVNWRLIHGHEPTPHYLSRRRAQQKTDAEIRRCLKRYTARHLFRLMEAAAAP